MSDHDPCCFMQGEHPCTVCAAIKQARAEEITGFNQTWKDNLPRLERRWYLDGYREAKAGMEARYR